MRNLILIALILSSTSFPACAQMAGGIGFWNVEGCDNLTITPSSNLDILKVDGVNHWLKNGNRLPIGPIPNSSLGSNYTDLVPVAYNETSGGYVDQVPEMPFNNYKVLFSIGPPRGSIPDPIVYQEYTVSRCEPSSEIRISWPSTGVTGPGSGVRDPIEVQRDLGSIVYFARPGGNPYSPVYILRFRPGVDTSAEEVGIIYPPSPDYQIRDVKLTYVGDPHGTPGHGAYIYIGVNTQADGGSSRWRLGVFRFQPSFEGTENIEAVDNFTINHDTSLGVRLLTSFSVDENYYYFVYRRGSDYPTVRKHNISGGVDQYVMSIGINSPSSTRGFRMVRNPSDGQYYGITARQGSGSTQTPDRTIRFNPSNESWQWLN